MARQTEIPFFISGDAISICFDVRVCVCVCVCVFACVCSGNIHRVVKEMRVLYRKSNGSRSWINYHRMFVLGGGSL